MGRQRRRTRDSPLPSSSKSSSTVVTLKLNEEDYNMLVHNLPELQLEEKVFSEPSEAASLPRNDDSKNEAETICPEVEVAQKEPELSLESNKEEASNAISLQLTNPKTKLSDFWFVARTKDVAISVTIQDDKEKAALANEVSACPNQPQYRMISYADLERLFMFGLGVGTKTPPAAPLYKHRPSWIPSKVHFACYPIRTEEDFVVRFYFVNILSGKPVNEKEFRLTVATFAPMLGNFCFLPNRLIGVTRKLSAEETLPFQVYLGAEKGLATIQFIASGKIKGSTFDSKSAMVVHYFLLDLLRSVNLWKFGDRNFLWQEKNVMDPEDQSLDFVALGEGIRLSVGSQNDRPMLILEPFAYMRDNRSVLAKLKRARDARENVNDQVRGILVINRFGITTHRVNDVKVEQCPMFTAAAKGSQISILNFLEHHGVKIEYPFQPLLSSSYLEEVAGTRREILMLPEICDEIKPLMVTKRHLRTESTAKILGTVEEWNERMELFVKRINLALGEVLKSWKLAIESKREENFHTRPECGAVDSSGWFP